MPSNHGSRSAGCYVSRSWRYRGGACRVRSGQAGSILHHAGGAGNRADLPGRLTSRRVACAYYATRSRPGQKRRSGSMRPTRAHTHEMTGREPAAAHRWGCSKKKRETPCIMLDHARCRINLIAAASRTVLSRSRCVALLFIDFEQPNRVRVHGTASVRHDDPPGHL
jgi:hypothetical protein